jgi:hypothetical protein
MAPLFLNPGIIICKLVISVTHRPFVPWGSGFWYPLNRRIFEPQTGAARFGEEKNLLPLQGFEPQFLDYLASTANRFKIIIIIMLIIGFISVQALERRGPTTRPTRIKKDTVTK